MPFRSAAKPARALARQARCNRTRTGSVAVREGGAAPRRDSSPAPQRGRKLACSASRTGRVQKTLRSGARGAAALRARPARDDRPPPVQAAATVSLLDPAGELAL